MKRRVVAVTGFIGSGKSEVINILRGWGYKTLNCDDIAKDVAEQKEVVDKVVELLGAQCADNGKLDRRYIREVVFSDEALLQRYQAIFFGEVRARLCDILRKMEGIVFVEIAVLDAFSFPWEEVWCVTSDRAQILQRVTARDGVSEENVKAILSLQRKCDAPTRTITNNGTLFLLQQQVAQALNSLLSQDE